YKQFFVRHISSTAHEWQASRYLHFHAARSKQTGGLQTRCHRDESVSARQVDRRVDHFPQKAAHPAPHAGCAMLAAWIPCMHRLAVELMMQIAGGQLQIIPMMMGQIGVLPTGAGLARLNT